MKVYKVELLIINFDGLAAQEVRDVIENVKYPNHCIAPQVMAIQERDIGEWEDDNPLNNDTTVMKEYNRLFKQ